MNYFALRVALLIVTVAAFVAVEYGRCLLVMLGLQSDERDH